MTAKSHWTNLASHFPAAKSPELPQATLFYAKDNASNSALQAPAVLMMQMLPQNAQNILVAIIGHVAMQMFAAVPILLTPVLIMHAED